MKKKMRWLLRKAAALLMFAGAVSSVRSTSETPTDAQNHWILAGILIIVGILLWREKGKTKHARKPSTSTAPTQQVISFRVKGVTFANKDGTNRQDLLWKISAKKPPFTDVTSRNVHLEPTRWKGEDAIECRVNGYQIGHVPKELVPEMLKAVKAKEVVITGFEVMGGGYKNNGEKMNFGAEISIRYGK